MRCVLLATTALACALSLSACGGGGGVGSTPTPPPAPNPPAPPPPPPPPPNTSLLNLTSSENFVNDAATGSANFPKTGTGQTATAAQATATVSYDVTTKGYAISVGGRSLTFLPADIDAAQSTSTLTVYVKRNEATTDSLTLTKPGTTGRFTFEYVGGGYWQRTTDGANDVSGSFNALSYGLTTPNAAVPRTGRAEYAVDVIGVQTVPNNVVGFTGSGTTQVDLTTGELTLRGTLTGTRVGNSGFGGSAKLSGAENAFAGSFSMSDGVGTSFGRLSGRFYGPAAQEIGASFSTNAASDGSAVVGTIIGRGGVLAPLAPFDAAKVNSDAGRLIAMFDKTAGTFSGTSEGQAPLIVNFDTAANAYTLIGSDKANDFKGRTVTDFATTHDELTDTPTSARPTFIQTKKWTRTVGAGDPQKYDISYFATGTWTPNAALVRTGDAGYAVGIIGTVADAEYKSFVNFTGRGSLVANLGAGTLTTVGTTFYEVPSGTPTNGLFDGRATISSTESSFLGTLSLTGVGTYNGSLSGHFYGPAAEEVGATFSASDGAGGVAAGVITGVSDPTLIAGRQGLLDLTATTLFSSRYVFGATGQRSAVREGSTLEYNPATKTYTYVTNEGDGPAGSPFVFGPSQLASGRSDADRTVYAYVTPGDNGSPPEPRIDFQATVFNPGPTNPTLALTYTSFADIIVKEGNLPRLTRYYYPFGVATPASQRPISGTASYAGIVHGGAVYFDGTGAPPDYALSGTSQLSADFGASTFSGNMTINGTNAVTSALRSFGTFGLTGQIAANGLGAQASNAGVILFGSVTGSNVSASRFAGRFYGANVAEFGAVFEIEQRNPDGSGANISGVTVGKRGQ